MANSSSSSTAWRFASFTSDSADANALPVAPVRSRTAWFAAAAASQSSASTTQADPTLGADSASFWRALFAWFMMRLDALDAWPPDTPDQRRPPPSWDMVGLLCLVLGG